MKYIMNFHLGKISRYATTVCLFIIAVTLTSCFKNFYTVKTNSGYDNLQTIAQGGDKKIIVHYTDETVAVKSADITNEHITGYIAPYLPARAEYEEPAADKRLHIYKYKHREILFNEVHVYANIPKPINTQLTMIRKEDVVKSNIYKPAKGASIGSHVLGGVIVAATIALIIASIGAASFTFDLGPMAW